MEKKKHPTTKRKHNEEEKKLNLRGKKHERKAKLRRISSFSLYRYLSLSRHKMNAMKRQNYTKKKVEHFKLGQKRHMEKVCIILSLVVQKR